MKRIISILLAFALIFSSISAWAETDDLQLALNDELQISSSGENSFDLEPNATTPSGYFEGLSASNHLKEYFQDFEAASPLSYHFGVMDKDAYVYYTNDYDGDKAGDRTKRYDTADYPFEAENSTKYLAVRQSVSAKASGSVNPKIGPSLQVMSMGDNEKFHISFYLKNNDFIYDKDVFYTYRNRSNVAVGLVRMGKDGKMTFAYDSSSYSVPVDYSLNRWYKVDAIFTHHAQSGVNDTVDYYLDGKYITTSNYSDFMNVSGYPLNVLTFCVRGNSANYTGISDSVLCVDNIYAKFYSADDTVPEVTINKFAYTNFDIANGTNSADGFYGAAENSVVDFANVSGVYGKKSTDNSIKLITDTAVSTATADPSGSWTNNNPSIRAYIFDMPKIKEDGRFPVGSQLKFSFSYAFKKHTPTGGGNDFVQLGGTSAVNFIPIGRSGLVSASGSTDTFTLAEEKWYNFDIILTVNNEKALDYTVYINGIPTISGTLDNASLKNNDGAFINNIRLHTYMTKGTVSESYLDDMYVEYFSGTSSDMAEPNRPIENSEVDLSENGKIFIPAGYNVSDLLEDTTGPVEVLRGNQTVNSGTVENALVIVGDLLPVYGYAYVKLKLMEPVITLGDGTVDVQAYVVSNQSEPVDITLVAAIYLNGKILSVNADSKTCSQGTTELSIEDIPIREGADVKVYTLNGLDSKLPIFDDQIYEVSYSDLIYARPVADDLKIISGSHPRVLIDAQRVNEISTSTDANIINWKNALLARADATLTAPVYDYSFFSTGEMKNVDNCMERIMDLGLSYLLTNDTRYSDRAYLEISAFENLSIADDMPMYLDVAEVTVIHAIAYDWMYSAWTNGQKNAILAKLLISIDYTNKIYKGEVADINGWLHSKNNWNAVCNGGIAIASIAAMEANVELCSEVAAKAIADLEYMLPKFGPDGAWEEGIGYWEYTMKYVVALCSTLNNAYNTDFGIESTAGLKKSAMFGISLEANTGNMNYGDAAPTHIHSPEMFYWADEYADATIGGAALWAINRFSVEPNAFDLIYYNPTYVDSAYTKPNSCYFAGTETLSLSSGTGISDTFIGIAGGYGSTGHGHLDSGSVILDMAGKRFFADIGAEHYGKEGYFSGKRYLYYRARPEGHNIFVINPKDETYGVNPYYGQRTDAFSKITAFDSLNKTAVMDLSYAYDRDTTSATRTISLNGANAIIKDQIYLKTRADIHWYFHTDAQVSISGNTATLTKDGESIIVTFDAGNNKGTLSLVNANRFNSTVAVNDTANDNYKKLDFCLNSASGRINVEITASR